MGEELVGQAALDVDLPGAFLDAAQADAVGTEAAAGDAAGSEGRRREIDGDAWGEKAVLKLMFAAMIRASERWRAIKISDFERRQMAAPREELDSEYEARNSLVKAASTEHAQANLSSRNRT